MDYEKIYEQLIESAIKNPKTDCYKEKHHIIPKSLGGSDDKNNIVLLSARQHFLAHWILYKIHKTTKMAYAWYSMCRVGKGQESRLQNSKLFEYAKKTRAKKLSEDSKGEKNNFYGKRHSPETLEIIRQKNKGRKASDETRAIMSLKRKGVKKTDEHKAKIGRSGLICFRNILTGESVRVPKEDIGGYDPKIWVNHYTYKLLHNTSVVCCPYCGKQAKDTNSFRRWHFGNCKKKQHTN